MRCITGTAISITLQEGEQMYNKVTMLRRIVQDLELKATPSGVTVLTFSIAVDRRYQTKGEEKKSDFFNCVAWRNEAEFISRFWSKGKPILVEGELQNRSYTDKNGVGRQVTEIIVDRACFTGDAKASTGSPAPKETKAETGATGYPFTGSMQTEERQSYTAQDFENAPGDDYPF